MNYISEGSVSHIMVLIVAEFNRTVIPNDKLSDGIFRILTQNSNQLPLK